MGRRTRDTLMGIWGFFDFWLFRWIGPFSTALLVPLALVLDMEIQVFREKYPNWPGLFNFVESVNFYKTILTFSIVALFGGLYGALRQKSIKALSKENSRLAYEVGAVVENIHSLFEGLLYSLSNKLQLDEAGTERVSIYVHRAKSHSFVPCGRFSHNPILKQKGRTSFPDNQGCIAKAWQEDWHFCNQFPDVTRTGQYIDYLLQKYQIPRNVGRSLKMKPALVAAKRISLNGSGVAILVFESTDRNRFTEAELRGRLSSVTEEYGRMILSIERYIPDPIIASEVGL